jgi:hypothetical protein
MGGVIARAAPLAAVGFAACALLAAGAQAAEGGSVRLRVMTLNIFYGGDELDLRTGDWCALRRPVRGAPAPRRRLQVRRQVGALPHRSSLIV